jgi:CelD/BcsL family acetyltransferase involved in cellulose biosynthesis
MATATNISVVDVDTSSFAVHANKGGLNVIDELAQEWRELCDDAVDDQPFFRPEWFRSHIGVFFPDAKIVLITARLNGRLYLVLPLLEEWSTFCKVPVRRLRAPVNVHCGRYDAVCRAGPERDAAIRATWKWLKDRDNWDLLHLHYVPEESSVGRLVADARADGFRTIQFADRPNPYVPVPSNPAFLKQLPHSTRLRTKLRQVRREYGSEGSLRFYRVDIADRVALKRFYELEASGWKGEEKSAILCDSKMLRFFNDLADFAAHQRYFRLYMLELNGRPIAAHFSLVLKGRCYSPKVAYDQHFKQIAPGHLIVEEILKDCAACGVYDFDITGVDDEWKMKWATEARPVSHHLIFAGALGNLAYVMGLGMRRQFGRFFPKRRTIV